MQNNEIGTTWWLIGFRVSVDQRSRGSFWGTQNKDEGLWGLCSQGSDYLNVYTFT